LASMIYWRREMKKSDYVVVSISYQRFLVPIDKVQQVLDLVKVIQPICYDSEDDVTIYRPENIVFSIELLNHEVKPRKAES
jgi:hypothetical protein